MNKTIGITLKELRKNNGVTQKQIGEFLNLNEREIMDLENGNSTLKSSALNKLCLLYGCSPENILDGKCGGSQKRIEFKNNNDLNAIAHMNLIIRNIEQLDGLLH